jgi:RimJ/RimL family protein N-acetyltransferase
MEITGPRIALRPATEGDLAFLQTLWNDGVAMRHLGYPRGMGVSEDSMQRWWAAAPLHHHIITQMAATPIGEFAYTVDGDGRVRFDVKIAGAAQGYGYGTEALALALRALFATADVTSILAEPASDNPPAQGMLRRCGFQPTPTENHPGRWQCTRESFSAAVDTCGLG